MEYIDFFLAIEPAAAGPAARAGQPAPKGLERPEKPRFGRLRGGGLSSIDRRSFRTL